MKLSCIHCGNDFTITADQLGGRGRCPHCRATISLPRADDGVEVEAEPLEPPSRVFENVICGLGSCVIHLIILIMLGLIRWGSAPGIGPGTEEDVFIGALPFESLSEQLDDQMELDPSEAVSENNSAQDSFEEIAPPDFAQDQQLANVSELATSAGIGVGSANEFSSAQARQSASGGGEDFDGLIQRLRRDGLDIVIVFDSTGSMSGEINEVKDQIDRIGAVLTQMVPKTRISIVTYRDETDQYLVKGTPLTSSVDTVKLYLDDIRAAGGGDEPEAVHAGLNWAMSRNRFRSRARKVVLLFGDAPPHRQYLGECLNLAQSFSRQQGGVVSTVTCRASRRMDEFVEIAQMGGGESFLTSDEREIMTQLIVLVFGSEHRRKVLDAFKLLDR